MKLLDDRDSNLDPVPAALGAGLGPGPPQRMAGSIQDPVPSGPSGLWPKGAPSLLLRGRDAPTVSRDRHFRRVARRPPAHLLRRGHLALVLTLLLAPTLALANDDARRAGHLQSQAQEAYDGGQLDQAMRLAKQAILLNAGPGTWLAQQIRIEVLERQGHIEEAMTFLEDYMGLDGLFPEHVAWGRETRGRLSGRLIVAAAEAERAAEGTQIRRGVGVGFLVGGAVPLATGIGFLANYGRLGGQAQYDGWAQAGGALLAVGIAAEATGAILLASSGMRSPVAVLPMPLRDGVALAIAFRPEVIP